MNPKTTKPNNSNDWIDRFYKEIGEIIFEDGNNITDAVKDFISSELQREREKTLKEVEGIIRNPENRKFWRRNITFDIKGFIDELLSKINKLKSK